MDKYISNIYLMLDKIFLQGLPKPRGLLDKSDFQVVLCHVVCDPVQGILYHFYAYIFMYYNWSFSFHPKSLHIGWV